MDIGGLPGVNGFEGLVSGMGEIEIVAAPVAAVADTP